MWCRGTNKSWCCWLRDTSLVDSIKQFIFSINSARISTGEQTSFSNKIFYFSSSDGRLCLLCPQTTRLKLLSRSQNIYSNMSLFMLAEQRLRFSTRDLLDLGWLGTLNLTRCSWLATSSASSTICSSITGDFRRERRGRTGDNSSTCLTTDFLKASPRNWQQDTTSTGHIFQTFLSKIFSSRNLSKADRLQISVEIEKLLSC